MTVGKINKDNYKGKVVILLDETSQSQSEYTAMAIQSGNQATIIGSQTAGADGNVSEITLPGGLETFISGIGVYYPDGKQTQRIGIAPGIVVSPTIQGLKYGKDEVLDRAIKYIKEQK